ncbi:Ig-like domain-containing protein [Brevibacillus fluminis]|uniref:Ig-like domain-containing protein n=1 Tax=Brevibacillus fluminis TaxID=511487 RepID=UPI003F8B6D38
MRLWSVKRYLLVVVGILLIIMQSVSPVMAKEAEKSMATFIPVHGASAISVKGEISLTFRSKVKLANGEALTSKKAETIAALIDARTGKKLETTYSWSPTKRKLTLKPVQQLPYQTDFALKLFPGTVKDADGKLNGAEEARFTTEPREPEFLIVTTPSNLAQNVAASSPITLTFNKAIQLPSGKPITKSTWEKAIEITDKDQKKVKFEPFWDAKSMRVTLDPEGNLQAGMRYTVVLAEKSLMDRQGSKNGQFSFSFTTAAQQDLIPPAVTIWPANGSKNVSLNSNVTIQFGENVVAANGAELANAEVIGLAIWKDEHGGMVSYSATWNKQSRTITLRAKGKLAPYTTYSILFPNSLVKDEAGNLNRSTQIMFSTGGK